MRYAIPLISVLVAIAAGCHCGPFAAHCERCDADCSEASECPRPARKTVCRKEAPADCEPEPIRVKLPPPQRIVIETPAAQPVAQPQFVPQSMPMAYQQPMMMPMPMMGMQQAQQPAPRRRLSIDIALPCLHWITEAAPVAVQQPVMMHQPMMMPMPYQQQPLFAQYAPQPPQQFAPQAAAPPAPPPAQICVPVTGTVCVPAPPGVTVAPTAAAATPGTVGISAAQAEEFCRLVEQMKKQMDKR